MKEKQEIIASKEFFLSKLIGLQEYPSEKPERLIDSRDGLSKWRKGWFTSVIGYLILAVQVGFITDEKIVNKINQKKLHWVDGDFKNQKLTTQKDIDEADELLEMAINLFED